MVEHVQLEQAIKALEAQRAILGNEAVEAALVGLRQKLAELERAETQRSSQPAFSLSGERKLVTIMFADISGFTAMAETMDPEAVRDLMNACFSQLVPVVERYGGKVDKFIGDDIMALFGAPAAHEDDPERALRAALELQSALTAFSAQHGIDLGIHVGLNTGMVIAGGIGSDGQQQYSVMGAAVNLAARLEDLSERGEILVGPDTYRLTAALFEFEPLAPARVKGKAEPVAVYRLLGFRAGSGAVRGLAGLVSPLVGRLAEAQALQAALQLQTSGGIVTLVGEAGLGKSRLVAEARHSLAAGSLRWVEGRCLSYGGPIAYLLWLDVLRGLLGVKLEDAPLAVRDTLRQQILALCPDQFDAVYPYLGRLLALPLETEAEAVVRRLDGRSLRAGSFRAVETVLEWTARQRPLVVVCEDLHWADPTSIELLEYLLPLTERVPILYICAFRPEREHGCWRIKETIAPHYRHTNLELLALSPNESTALIGNLLHIQDLPAELCARILNRAEGNPFYVEEIIRSLINSGVIVREAEAESPATPTGRCHATREAAEIVLPDTLQGVLVARIDRLQEESKRVLQMASVIGRVFLYRILAAIAQTEQELDEHLEILKQEEMIRERAQVPELEYIFKHELTREAAYHGLLRKQRQVFHRQVAETLERLFQDRIEEQVDLLAYHWERAEELQKAVPYLLQAGQKAVRMSANQEAIAHFTRGLELLQALPDTPQRCHQEFVLQLALSAPYIATRGWGAPEVGQACRRARELSRQIGQLPQLPSLLNLLYQFYLIRAEHETALELAQEILAVAQQGQDPLQIAFPLGSSGISSFYVGDFTSARARQEQTFAAYDREAHRALAFIYGQDLGVLQLGYLSRTMWFLGYPDRAAALNREAITLAQELEHPFSQALAFAMACWTRIKRREVAAAREQAEAVIRIAAPRGFVFFESMGLCFQGWAQIQEGTIEAGMGQIRQSMARLRATGTEFHRPQFLSWLAEGHARAGEVEAGLALLVEALDLVEKTGERYYAAEVHRLKADLLWMQGNGQAAEVDYQQALQVSRRQSARSLELRAALSLSRLWQAQGKPEQARSLLAEIYGWFTEGFDTPDLQDARAVLDQLT